MQASYEGKTSYPELYNFITSDNELLLPQLAKQLQKYYLIKWDDAQSFVQVSPIVMMAKLGKVLHLKTLLALPCEDKLAGEALAFGMRKGSLEICNLFLKRHDAHDLIENHAKKFIDFHSIIYSRHWEVFVRLLEWDCFKNEIAKRDPKAIYYADMNGQAHIVNLLLSHPDIFVEIDREGELSSQVDLFVLNKCESLKKLINTSENSRSRFNLSGVNEIKLCVHLLKHITRKNSDETNQYIDNLLFIPAIKELAHHNSNELLHIAQTAGNHTAEQFLLQISMVNTLFKWHSTYNAVHGFFTLPKPPLDESDRLEDNCTIS